MKIINVTNNFRQLVDEQLRNTDALTVEVYSAGNTTAIFTTAATHYELPTNIVRLDLMNANAFKTFS